MEVWATLEMPFNGLFEHKCSISQYLSQEQHLSTEMFIFETFPKLAILYNLK